MSRNGWTGLTMALGRRGTAIGVLAIVGAMAASPACAVSNAASCDAVCANALGQCQAGSVDSCLSSCRKWYAGVSAACTEERDKFLICMQGANDLDCSSTTSAAPSCYSQGAALTQCSGGAATDGGSSGASYDGGGGSGGGSSSGSASDAGTSSGGSSSGSPSTSGGGSGGGDAAADGSSEAGGSCSSPPITFGGATSACTACAGAQCCSQDLACGASSDCVAEVSCFGSCTTGSCETSCAQAHPTGQQYQNALLICVSNRCSAQCYGSNPNPCQVVQGWGNNCGANIGGDPARLYLCNAGAVVGSVVCQNGCFAAPVGQPDYCVGSDPCVNNVFSSQATYCGSNLGPGAVQSDLYTCNGATTASKVACANGCYAAPPGQADHCN